MLKQNMSYKLFNEAILKSSQQSAMTNSKINKGWLHHIKSTLPPVLADRNAILHSIRADQYPPSQETIFNLKTLRQEMDKIIEISKARWSRHLAETIHNMLFNPKGALGKYTYSLKRVESSSHIFKTISNKASLGRPF